MASWMSRVISPASPIPKLIVLKTAPFSKERDRALRFISPAFPTASSPNALVI